MKSATRTTRAYDTSIRFRVSRIVLALTFFGCTNRLDPTLEVAGGDAGKTDDLLASCTTFLSNESEYLFCADELAFAAAAHDCALRDAALVAVGSTEEDALVATNVEELVTGDTWLGGTRTEDLVWSWPDGTVFWRGGPDGMAEDDAFVHWKGGEPNNASTTSPDPERCLALLLAGDWNDRACELPLPYVCERPL